MASSPPYEGTLACNSTGAGAVSYCPDEGFYCPSTEEDPFGLSCYGETGPQILDSLSKTYDAISSENTVLTDLIAIPAKSRFETRRVMQQHTSMRRRAALATPMRLP